MRFLHWLLNKSKHYPVIDTDEIYPLHFLDNLATARAVVLSETLLVNAVLDPDKLQNGLTDLISNYGDWRKLGGRLRMRADDGNVELHVPREFDAKHRPAIQFTTEAFKMALAEHTLGSQFPRPSLSAGGHWHGGPPSLHPGPDTFVPFSALAHGPSTLEDYLCSDEPILRVHVTSFADATVVVLIWPHAVAGALGVKEILSAWSRVLRDDDGGTATSTVPELLGARKDVLDGIGTERDTDKFEPYSLENREIKGWGFVRFVARLLWTLFWRPRPDSRTVFLPRDLVSGLRRACLRDLQRQAGGEEQFGSASGVEGPDKVIQLAQPFLSEGDVLTAWVSRFIAQSRGGNRPALIFNPLDISTRLDDLEWGRKAASGADGGGVYVQNMAGAVYTHIDAPVLLKGPLGELAFAVRSSIQASATDRQIRAQLRIFRSLGNNKREPLYGDPSAQFVVFSNWTKFDLFNAVDFSPAVLTSGSEIDTSDATTGKPVYMHCQSLGKDLQGNYWITAFCYPDDWAQLERYIEETCRRIDITPLVN